MNRTLIPRSSRTRRRRSRISAWTVTSSALVGSSASSTSERSASAIAIAIRCAWPPESSCGYRSSRSGESRTSRNALGRALGRLALADAVQPERPLEELAHLEQRVERRHGTLEDHRDAAPADLAQPALGRADELLAVEADASLDPRAEGRREAEHRERRDRLARAALAGQAEDLARAELETVEVDDPAGAERDPQVVQRELRLGHRVVSTRLGSSTSRRPSPSRLKATAVRKIAAPGKVTSHHCVVKNA